MRFPGEGREDGGSPADATAGSDLHQAERIQAAAPWSVGESLDHEVVWMRAKLVRILASIGSLAAVVVTASANSKIG